MSSVFHLAVYCFHKPSHLPSFVFFRTICSVLHLGQRRKGSAPISFSIPRTAIKQRLWEWQFDKIHLKVRQSGKVVKSGYNRLFAAIVIHTVPNCHTGERGMIKIKVTIIQCRIQTLRWGGGWSSRPWYKVGGSPKHFSLPFGPQFGLKIRVALLWICHCHFKWCQLLASLVPVCLLLSSMVVLWHVKTLFILWGLARNSRG